MSLVKQAKSNGEISAQLSLTYGTVGDYLYRIFRKLHVSNRTELAMLDIQDPAIPK